MIRCSKPIYYTLFFIAKPPAVSRATRRIDIGNLSLGDGLRSAFMKYACKINKKSTTIGCFCEIFCAKAKLCIKKV